jgi:hypothetical protein
MIDLVKEGKVATLSTTYDKVAFGSLSPYVLDSKGNPVIFVSDMALHTKNLKKDPKCSLMIAKLSKDDIFNSARITFVGKMVKVPDKELDVIRKIYLEKYPAAKNFVELEDFAFYRLEIDKIYWVGGFGDIEWIDVKEYLENFNE